MAIAFRHDFDPSRYYSDDELLELASRYDLRFERSAEGKLIVAPPPGTWTGKRNADLVFQLELWNRQRKLGEAFGVDTGFRFPDGSILAPDAAWVEASRCAALTDGDREKYAPIAPDVAFELTSPTDRLNAVRKKMQAYLRNGVRLGVLIAVAARSVELYRPSRPVEAHAHPTHVPLDPELPGFVLETAELFS
jgi:Uma2 family endonuclease